MTSDVHNTFSRRKIGEILVSLGAMAPAEVELVLAHMSESGRRFGNTAIAEGVINEDILAQALAEQFYLPFTALDNFVPDADLVNAIPSGLLLKYQVLPLHRDDTGLVVAVSDPTKVDALDELELQLGMPLSVQVAPAGKIHKILERGDLGSKQVLREVSEDFKLQLVK